jgi:hypothetical protein
MSRGFLIVVAMIATTPLVAWQGVAHTTPLDAINAIVLPLYWLRLLMRGERMRFPFALWFWLIMLGSFTGLWAAHARTRALLTISQDVYLYLWFVTVIDLVVRYCRIVPIVVTWVVVACAITLLSYVDRNTGALGGAFAGSVRAAGTFLNPNMFGSYLGISFFLAWSIARSARRWMFVALPILVLGLIDTGSNGALAGFVAGTTVAVLSRPTRPLWVIGSGLVLAALGVLAIGVMQNERTRERVLDMFRGGRSQIGGAAAGSAEERWPIWLDAAETIRNHPMGVGPDNFNSRGGPISGTYYGPHNDYVGMMVERGPFGLIGWVGLLGGTLALIPTLRKRSELRMEALYGLVAYQAMHSNVIEAFHFRHLWFALALIVAAATALKAQEATSERWMEAA